MCKLFIFTPTYNRLKNLVKLYESLKNQTYKEFIWLIVDDGSTDNTESYVRQLQSKNVFDIVYLKKENGGKHTAYNLALDYMGTDGWHMVVDSDDWLANTAVENIFNDISSLQDSKLGVVYPRYSLTEKLRWLPKEATDVNIPDIKLKYGVSVETAILIRNSFIGNIRFPIFEGEKFLSEEIFYIELAKIGSFEVSSSKIYYYEYLQSGLTKNIFRLWLQNPKGVFLLLKKRDDYINRKLSGIRRIVESIKVALNKDALAMSLPKFRYKLRGFKSVILLPLSTLVYLKRFRKFVKINK